MFCEEKDLGILNKPPDEFVDKDRANENNSVSKKLNNKR